jgi:tetratricopeptide (TPR) repeat protein
MLDSLVGRERECEELARGLEAALNGRGSLFLISGEPGVGKTALADLVAGRAQADKAEVFWGRCWEAGGAPPFWPWVQILRGYLRELGPDAMRDVAGTAWPQLVQLVPELDPSARESQAGRWDDARFALFDAVSSFVIAASAQRPTVLVFDDLHAGDEPSLLLLEFLARELRTGSLLVLATYRRGEGEPTIRTVLGRIARDAELLPLAGLGRDDLDAFIMRRTGIEVAPSVAQALHEATDGNPFLLDEVVRLLAADHVLGDPEAVDPDRLPIPDGVRATVEQRLDPLDDAVRAVLEAAAVLGKEFRLAALERMVDMARADVVVALGEATRIRLIATDDEAVARYRFSHMLLRETIYEGLPALRRAELHRRAGVALESVYRKDPAPHLAALAHHFVNAARAGDAEVAVGYARSAGDRAMGQFAFEQAARHYRQALEALSLLDDADPHVRCELLLAQGAAERKAADRVVAQATFQEASDLAIRLGDATKQARAALGYAGRYWTAGIVDDTLISLLEGALRALRDTDPDATKLRSALLSRLGTALYYTDQRERADEVSSEAVRLARDTGDKGALAVALDQRLGAVWGPDNLDERLEHSRQVIELAEGVGDRETALRGRAFHVTSLIETGDVATADHELDFAVAIAEELRQPRYLWHVYGLKALRELMSGRMDEAEALAKRALAAGSTVDETGAAHYYGVQGSTERRGRGDLAAVIEPMRDFVRRYPLLRGWRAVLALCLAAVGRHAEARQELDAVGSNGWTDLARDSNWMQTIAYASEASWRLRYDRHAERLYELLLPYDGRLGVLGRVANISVGAISRYLGLLAAVLGRWEDAHRHLDDALALHDRTGARLWAVQTLVDYGGVLLEQGRAEDEPRALEMLDAALAEAEELGLDRLVAEAETVRGERERTEPRPAPQTQSGTFRRQGDYWEVGFEGATTLIKDVKGLRLIAELLRHPGAEFHAVELLATTGGRPATGAPAPARAADAGLAAPGADDAGALLDDQAKAAYRERLEGLRAELEEAEEWGDPERAAKAREEMDFIAHELSSAVGLGGRDRKAASNAERARVNVTRTIKLAVQKIGENDPDLGHYLSRAIKTGTFCSHEPDPRAPVDWSL